MKRLLLILCMVVGLPTCLSMNAEEIEVPLSAEKIVWPIGSERPARGPVDIPSVSIDNHTLYINSSHPDYILQLVDVDDNVVYEVFVSANTNSVVLPSIYVGEYRLNLLTNNWCFWGYIEL